MSKLSLYILLVVSLKLIFVSSQACTEPDNCEKGSCCRSGFCTAECDDFCYENSECDSGCCKGNKCQDTYKTCSQADYYVTTAPDLLNSCHYDCGDYGECCITGECRSCNQTTTLPSREYPIDNVNYDEYYEDSGSSGSDLGAGGIAGIVIAAVVLGIIVRCLLRYYCCRRESVVVVHRRTTCARVPILEDDEVQREHERAERVFPTRLPPAYRPRPLQHNPENPASGPPPVYATTTRINPKQTTLLAQRVGNNRNTNNLGGIQQDKRMVPPCAVSQQHSASPSQSTNPVQTYQTQRVRGHAKQMRGVSQGSFRIPSSTKPASRLPNTS